jgi:FkbM family methyltransferase
MPAVKVVHGFEPFAVPFNRALENFALNPALAAKIKPHNIGLSVKNERLSVPYDANSTLYTSIRGTRGDTRADIVLRNAAGILRDIIGKIGPGQEIVIKLDCEGSEFAILESLDAAGLIPEVRVFMIESHNWWSPGRTQEELISRFIQNGFDVIDHTRPLAPAAGMLYAIRSSQRRVAKNRKSFRPWRVFRVENTPATGVRRSLFKRA